jgi:tetratricopeptide (TPR) repeat protein
VKEIHAQLEKVRELLRAEKAAEAQRLFAEIAEESSVEYLLVKGELEQKFQQWGKAHNSFTRVLEIDPSNTQAKTRLEMIKGILGFFNPDQFNP